MYDTNFRQGDSITVEVKNTPYINRDVPISQQDPRWASTAWLSVFDPCGNIFIDCPMTPCSDRIGYYLFRIQTDTTYPIGLYKMKATLTNIVPELLSSCTSDTSGMSDDNLATNVAWKTFRLVNSEVF